MPATALQVDESTFHAYIEKYAVDLCRRWRIPRGEVDDVVQEVWTEILASLASFRPDGDFSNWTRGIAWKVIRKHVRKSQQYAKRFSEYHANIDEHPAPDPSPERYVQREQARCLISIAAQGVSSRQMAVFVLHAIDGMTHVEIADELDVSESTSQKCFQRTRDHLARCLRGKVFSAMPLDVIGCNEPAPSTVGHSRWNERSHYAGQVAAVILALLTFIPSNHALSVPASASGEIRTIASIQTAAMYELDKHLYLHDEPWVLRDAPSIKSEPASLPSVRAVSVPTRVVDKPAHLRGRRPVPSYHYTAQPSAHRPDNQR